MSINTKHFISSYCRWNHSTNKTLRIVFISNFCSCYWIQSPFMAMFLAACQTFHNLCLLPLGCCCCETTFLRFYISAHWQSVYFRLRGKGRTRSIDEKWNNNYLLVVHVSWQLSFKKWTWQYCSFHIAVMLGAVSALQSKKSVNFSAKVNRNDQDRKRNCKRFLQIQCMFSLQ